jgi:hypothetical protein
MRMCRAVLLLVSVLGVAACATTSDGDEARTILVEVTHAPVDRGPLTIFISPVYQRRIRLGDVLPGGDARYSYEVRRGGPYSLTAAPQIQQGSSMTVRFDLTDDTEHLVWDLRTNIVQVR